MAVSLDDLLLIIGTKEAQIYELQRQNGVLAHELQALKPKPESTPAEVLPFPREVKNEQTQ